MYRMWSAPGDELKQLKLRAKLCVYHSGNNCTSPGDREFVIHDGGLANLK
jgi:hypothetical protein